MLKIETKTMTKAIEKAKTVHPRVRVISAADRTYSVTGSKGDNYTVKFAVADGKKLAECDCPARGMCYHIASAAQVNVMVQSVRRQGASAPSPTDCPCACHVTGPRSPACTDCEDRHQTPDTEDETAPASPEPTWDEMANAQIIKPQPAPVRVGGWMI